MTLNCEYDQSAEGECSQQPGLKFVGTKTIEPPGPVPFILAAASAKTCTEDSLHFLLTDYAPSATEADFFRYEEGEYCDEPVPSAMLLNAFAKWSRPMTSDHSNGPKG